MTQTEIYKLNKPEKTDKVNIEDINENFEIIEEELARKVIPIALVDEIDLTAEYWSINVTEQLTAVANRFITDLKMGIPVAVSFTYNSTPFVVMLNEWFESTADTGYTVSGIFANPRDKAIISRFDLFAYLGDTMSADLDFTLSAGAAGTVKTVNGVEPDEDGNVEVVVSVTEPATAKLDFSNWDLEEGAYYRETLDDGSSIVHNIVREDGVITSIGGITLSGVN